MSGLALMIDTRHRRRDLTGGSETPDRHTAKSGEKPETPLFGEQGQG